MLAASNLRGQELLLVLFEVLPRASTVRKRRVLKALARL
jgi:hypothetical protein